MAVTPTWKASFSFSASMDRAPLRLCSISVPPRAAPPLSSAMSRMRVPAGNVCRRPRESVSASSAAPASSCSSRRAQALPKCLKPTGVKNVGTRNRAASSASERLVG